MAKKLILLKEYNGYRKDTHITIRDAKAEKLVKEKVARHLLPQEIKEEEDLKQETEK